MKELIQKIYRDKAPYYIEAITSLDSDCIRYIFLNILVPDDKPGDLDIIVPPEQYKTVVMVLKNCGFKEYCRYNSQQILWNKYVYGLGFIQMHIHIDFCFYNRKLISFRNIYQGMNLLSCEQEYLFFLLESFYKNQFREKRSKFEAFQLQINKDRVNDIIKKDFIHIVSVIKKAENLYLEGKQPGKGEFLVELIKENKINAASYIMLHLLKKAKKRLFFDKDDIVIVFWGMDGVGKTSISENVRAITSKGGLYSRVIYMGIKRSVVNKLRVGVLSLRKIPSVPKSAFDCRGRKNKLFFRNIYQICIGILYWLEYNLQWLFRIKLRKATARTVWLLDRSFFDVLIHYNSKLLTFLFFKLSFKIDIIVFLTADIDKLCARKTSIAVKDFEEMKAQYDFLLSTIRAFHENLLTADTSVASESETAHLVIREIMKTMVGA